MGVVLGLHGYGGVGKDTLADALVDNYGFVKIAFADPVREILYRMNPVVVIEDNQPVSLQEVVDRIGWTEAKHLYPSVREMLVGLGMGARQSIGPRVWIDEAMRRAGNHERIVFSDVRMLDEAVFLRDVYRAILVHVVRPGVGPAHNQELSSLPPAMLDYVIENDGDIVDLKAKADILMNRLALKGLVS